VATIGWFVTFVSALLVGISAALLAPVAIDGVVRSIRTARIRAQVGNLDCSQQLNPIQLLLEDCCKNGVSLFKPVAGLLLKSRLLQRKISLIVLALREHIQGISAQPVLEVILTVSVLLGLLVYLLFAQWSLAIASMIAPIVILSMRSERWQNRQQELLHEQLPDALRALGMCFSAGFSLQQALEQTAKETAQPLKTELSRTTYDMQTGCSVLEALGKLEQRTSLPDLQFVSIAMEIQHNTGGSLREILDSAADSINSAFELNRSMQVQTAQAKMSARVVSLMPILLMLVLSVAMEGYLETFFSSVSGFMLLITALGMELIGVMSIRKILGLNLD
jgi:tight adherence protein B